jgi:hypothetical protein
MTQGLQTYRDPAAAPPRAHVRYWLMGPLARVTLSVTVVAASVWFFIGTGPHHDHSALVWTLAGGGSTLCVAVMVLFFWQRATVEVDRSARTVRLTRARWPLRSGVRTLPLSSVRDAVVTMNPDGDAPGHMIELVVDGQPNVPLLEGIWVYDGKRQGAIAAEIRALLDPPAGDREVIDR